MSRSTRSDSWAWIRSMPTRSIQRTAAARPTACAALGTPASNFCGAGAYVERSILTSSIIEPPVSKGGMASSSSARPQSTPTPIGPYSLWPLKAMKSAPSVVTSTDRCGTDWQASTTTRAPTACARAASSAPG